MNPFYSRRRLLGLAAGAVAAALAGCGGTQQQAFDPQANEKQQEARRKNMAERPIRPPGQVGGGQAAARRGRSGG